MAKLNTRCAAALCLALAMPAGARASSIFLTGHDPDFHANQGANASGAMHFNQVAISFVQDPLYNAFVATAPKFLFVESSITPPSGNIDGKAGIVDSGYTQGTQFDTADASSLNAALDQLGKPGGYSAIVVASDHGGILTSAELDILNSRSADIIHFLNAGGGLYAMAESNAAGLIGSSARYGFLPFIVTSTSLQEQETGNTLSTFGTDIGLTLNDINANFSHNAFTVSGGMSAVDFDPAGNVLSVATHAAIDVHGVVPLPASVMLLGGACAVLGAWSERGRRRAK